MSKKDMEVNETEIIDGDTISDGSNENDEEVIPPTEGDEDEPSDTSTDDEKSDEDDEDEDEKSEDESDENEDSAHYQQPKPVPGETPRERALRKEIEGLKRQRREMRMGKILSDDHDELDEDNEDYQNLLKVYSPDEIKTMEQAIDVLASRKGYVKKTETYQTLANTLLENFVASHPEYDSSNDPGDIRWEKFQEILLRDYNLKGKRSEKELKRVFDKVHLDVVDELGESEVDVPNRQSRIQAQKQKIKSVSHGGSGGTRSQTARGGSSKVDPSVKGFFKGFDDSDFADE